MTPLDLGNTRPLQRGPHPRRFTLIVMGHGRWEYLKQTVASVYESVGVRFARTVFSYDGVSDANWSPSLWPADHTVLTTGTERQGLTANLTQAWGALTDADDYVFHVEEDYLIHDAPLDAMADVLDANPTVANMALVRQPWSAEEHKAGGLLFGSHIAGQVVDRGGWLEHKRIFTLNPFVARAETLRSLVPGVEQSLTAQCLDRGWSFGFWGGLHDEPRVEHVGYEGGMGSEGWRA